MVLKDWTASTYWLPQGEILMTRIFTKSSILIAFAVVQTSLIQLCYVQVAWINLFCVTFLIEKREETYDILLFYRFLWSEP